MLEIGVVRVDGEPREIKRRWLERRMSSDPRDRSGVWRFREFLPGAYGPRETITLAEGNVPLVRG
ncbi:MAG: threonine synthase, partial [Bryobacteraceae bacterium]